MLFSFQAPCPIINVSVTATEGAISIEWETVSRIDCGFPEKAIVFVNETQNYISLERNAKRALVRGAFENCRIYQIRLTLVNSVGTTPFKEAILVKMPPPGRALSSI